MRKEVVRWYFIWNAFESTASLHIHMSEYNYNEDGVLIHVVVL